MKKIILTLTLILSIAVFLSCSREYTVKVSCGEGGTVAVSTTGIGSTDSLKVHPGDTVTLTVVPDDGFLFREWMIFGIGDEQQLTTTGPHSATFIMPAKDVVAHANFQKDPRTDYYGTWIYKKGYNEEKITLTKGTYVRELTFDINSFLVTFADTLDNLVWEPIRNSAGDHTTDYPTGYRIFGTVVKTSPASTHRLVGEQSEAQPGDTVVVWYYLRNTDKGALMKGKSESQAHEAAYNPLVKQP
jgi:hypothetical protein